MNLDLQKTGLVLEGGGMRGVFTCGVLDFMMDHHMQFPYVIGVSAGACNGLSYMSHQRGRAKFSNIDMLAEYHYIGLKYLWYQHSILDQHLLYDLFPTKILPYDFQAYFNNPARDRKSMLSGRERKQGWLETGGYCQSFKQSSVCLSDYIRGRASDARWRYCRFYTCLAGHESGL